MLGSRGMRVSDLLPLGAFAILAAGWPACQPSGTSVTASAKSGARCGITIVYQNNDNGEIEPCG